ncbi:hypothetical protein ACFOUP_08735 [Belliella kenyensis]|uniref:DUF2185 domain-containing protein n=1 Tax=Belliella kenyensis TaxID=1472724 RepID=A0ABV8ELP0_9BACT|nr:hypothetical protein [Belliella kenyensis]MCH7403883.1 hypothetical protein [Belliella kenyensis]MDN3604887.1 hypothetical protein [Belliella kenyensis]
MKQFQENLDTAVFTTKYVLEKQSPITHVYHYDEDGAWQFSGLEEIDNNQDFRVVSLEEIIKLDGSILEISDLPLGYEAFREKPGSSWEIVKTS